MYEDRTKAAIKSEMKFLSPDNFEIASIVCLEKRRYKLIWITIAERTVHWVRLCTASKCTRKVKDGTYCARCLVNERKFREAVVLIGGIVIGEFLGQTIRIQCKCKNNHDCYPLPSTVSLKGNICLICLKMSPDDAKRKFYEKIQALGGTVIGEYKTAKIKVSCICSNNHPCEVIPDAFKREGVGMCRICAGKCIEVGKANFEERIQSRGFRMQSEYKNCRSSVTVACPQGHSITRHVSTFYVIEGGVCETCYPRFKGQTRLGKHFN